MWCFHLRLCVEGMVAMAVGTVVRFDSGQGYGFIQPDDGGEDVFLHARLIDEDAKDHLRAGSRVEFVAVRGDRGVKAVEAHLLRQGADLTESPPVAAPEGKGAAPATDVEASDVEDEDVWTAASLRDEVTELLISASPSLTATQIVEVRQAVVQMATDYGWVAE
jgi:CspA family cold shock protein